MPPSHAKLRTNTLRKEKRNVDNARRATRDRREQLLTLVNNWDPAGLIASGAPRDRYEGLVDTIFSALSAGKTKEQLRTILETELRDQFRSAATGVESFVNRAFAWFELGVE